MTEAPERAIYGIAADLLDQGRIVHGLSLLVTAVGFAVLVGAGSVARPAAPGLAAASVAAGIAETVLALRTRLDAALFRRLAAGLAVDAFDAGMMALRLMPGPKAGRPAVDRAAGAKRLLVLQGATLLAQLAALALALREG